MLINFSDIPAHQNLFLDYLYEFKNVENFYNKNFRDNSAYTETFIELSKANKNRNLLVEIISKQYNEPDFRQEGLEISESTKLNIDLLKQNTTFAIVTGQQLGILGGPLYTFYKIFTAIKLSGYLKERYSSYNFVPVFWLEGDDHDFNEVKSINLINNENELVKLQYNDGVPEDINRGSVGKIKFTEDINNLLNDINTLLRENDFKSPLMEKLRSIYSEGKTFRDCFKKLLFDLFDKYGLIIFDPSDSEVKQMLKPVFKKAIEDFRIHTHKIVKASADLEEKYHAQVKVRPINLFMSENDGRYLIEPVDEEFRLKGKRRKFTKEALLNLIETEPDKFSPNVLLRPICQDFLLPTACYIGGPSEISYFAQVIPFYKFYNLVQPIIYPRSSVTIVENTVQKITDKYNFNYSDYFVSDGELYERIIKTESDIDVDKEFEKSINETNYAIDSLREKLFAIDKSLNDIAVKTKEKIQQNLELLKTKADEAQKKKHEITLRQITKALNLIYPNSNLQERELNFIYFAHKYGLNILDWIYNELTINKFEHQIIEM